MITQSTKQENSIYKEMELRVYQLNRLEIANVVAVMLSAPEREAALQLVADEHAFNLLKLDEIAVLANQSEDLKTKFIRQKLHIESSKLSEKEKTNAILTTACLLSRIHFQIENLSDDELYLLAQTMVKVPLKDYSIYGRILSASDLMLSINSIARNNEKLEVTDDTFDYCSNECGACELADLEYQQAVKVLLPLLNTRKEDAKFYNLVLSR